MKWHLVNHIIGVYSKISKWKFKADLHFHSGIPHPHKGKSLQFWGILQHRFNHLKIISCQDRQEAPSNNQQEEEICKAVTTFWKEVQRSCVSTICKKSLVFVIRTFFLNMRLQIIATFASTYMMSFEVITSTTLQHLNKRC